jgi:hypothetical protein
LIYPAVTGSACTKTSTAKTLEFVQSGLDAVLTGTTIQRTAPPEIMLTSASPFVVTVQLSSPQPLNPQTVSVLSSQLASKLGMSVELHGTINLGTSYRSALTAARPDAGITPEDRSAVNQLINRIQQDNLYLQVSYTPGRAGADARKTPRLPPRFETFFRIAN